MSFQLGLIYFPTFGTELSSTIQFSVLLLHLEKKYLVCERCVPLQTKAKYKEDKENPKIMQPV